MYHSISLFILRKKLNCDHFLSTEEFAYAVYNLEMLLINLEKVITIYLFSYIFLNIQTTLIVHLSYFLIRLFAGGWHAQSSKGCTLSSIFIFILLPNLVQSLQVTVNTSLFIILAMGICATIWTYAPAGTEKRTITDAVLRRKLKQKALFVTCLLLVFAYVTPVADLRTLMLLGIGVETMTIHPYFYQLMKRGNKND